MLQHTCVLQHFHILGLKLKTDLVLVKGERDVEIAALDHPAHCPMPKV